MKDLSSLNKVFFFKDLDSIRIVPNSIEHAYLLLLEKNLERSLAVFSSIDSPRALWGISLVQILQGKLLRYPTFFELRNFLEIDLDFLIKNELLDYVEQFLGALDFLSSINHEVYKFVGRVMYENTLYKAALNYLEKSKRIFYNDPELHFILARYYFNSKNYIEALFSINECLRILPDYYPALSLKSKIEQIGI